jgi:hypothetical protein
MFIALTVSAARVYQNRMSFHPGPVSRWIWAPALFGLVWVARGQGEELRLTPNVPIPEFQNRLQDVKPYNFDAPPEGMFRTIELTEGFEEELGFRRTHEIVPLRPTDQFRPDSPAVFVVFQLHQHYQAFQVFGRCYPEEVPSLDPQTLLSQDAMYIALEDETGYLKLFPPQGGWKPGRYKVEIHVGEQVNELSLIGTMRFTVVADHSTGTAASK